MPTFACLRCKSVFHKPEKVPFTPGSRGYGYEELYAPVLVPEVSLLLKGSVCSLWNATQLRTQTLQTWDVCTWAGRLTTFTKTKPGDKIAFRKVWKPTFIDVRQKVSKLKHSKQVLTKQVRTLRLHEILYKAAFTKQPLEFVLFFSILLNKFLNYFQSRPCTKV